MYFLVVLSSTTGEREDYIKSLITAENEFEAGKKAIEDQAYGKLKWEDEDFNSAEDLNGEIHLKIDDVREIPEEHFKILKQYL